MDPAIFSKPKQIQDVMHHQVACARAYSCDVQVPVIMDPATFSQPMLHIARLIADNVLLQVIVIMDPATSSKPRLHMARLATGNVVPPKEKRYVFDRAYDGNTDNRTLYYGTVKVSCQPALSNASCSACVRAFCFSLMTAIQSAQHSHHGMVIMAQSA